MAESAMRVMLVKLSYLLRPEELNVMKYMCKDFIPLKRREEIKTSVDLFNELEQRGKLKANDVSFIEYLLQAACVGRTDVLGIFSAYIHSRGDVSHVAQCQNQSQQMCNSTDLTALFIFLEENLGREYLMVLRRLGMEDHALDRLRDEHPHNVREIIHKALLLWHSLKCNSACIVKVINALKGERRNDLAEKLENGQIL